VKIDSPICGESMKKKMLIDACSFAARFLLLLEVAMDGELASSEPNSHGATKSLFCESRGYSIFVVKAGSKGKEPFRRPLCKRLKLSRLCHISSEHRSLHFYLTCVVSLLGAGVPAEAESEMVSACAW